MKFKETIVDAPDDAKKKKKKKPKKVKKSKKFEFKATVIHDKDYVSDKMRRAKDKVKELRNVTFANTQMYWDSYALMIAAYFSQEYIKNLDYFQYKYSYFNKKKTLSEDDLNELKVLASLDDLNSDITNDNKTRTIDVDLTSVSHNFFAADDLDNIYKSLVKESKTISHHSLQYLIKLFNLLVTYVNDKAFRIWFYDNVVVKEKKAKSDKKSIIIFNEKTIKNILTHQYLSNKFKERGN